MKIITTNTTQLYAINLPFELSFVWYKKRETFTLKGYWFTPTGKAKVWIGEISTMHLGHINDKDDKKIVALMKKYKCDILSNGTKYYTRAGTGLVEITDAYLIINTLLNEWNVRWEQEHWEIKKEHIYHLDDFTIIKDE